MELLQLRYYYESARNENFTKAAEKYQVPISSVSASVRRLEKELGCELFDRSSNRITLNNNGRRLQQSLYSVFNELDGAVGALTAPGTDMREIRMLVRAMRGHITDYIIDFSRKRPHTAFKTVFDFGETDLDNYDIIIDEKTDIYAGYDSFELFNMRLRLRVAEGHPLLGQKLCLNQLYDHPFVSLSENSNMHRILMTSCKQAGFIPNVVAQINDIECYEKLIESGIGIGIGRDTIRTRHSHRIRPLQVTDFQERYEVYVYYKHHENYGNVKQFLDYLKVHAHTHL